MSNSFTAKALIGRKRDNFNLAFPCLFLFFFNSGGRKITTTGRNLNVVDKVIISDDQRSNLTVSLNLLYNTKWRSIKRLGFVPKVLGGSQHFSNAYTHLTSVILLK